MRVGGRSIVAVGLALLAACAPPPPRPTRVPLAEAVRRFLLPPLTGVPQPGGTAHEAVVTQAYARLLAGELDLAEHQAAAVLVSDPGDAPAGILLGQVDLARGRLAEVVARLRPIVLDRPTLVAAHVALARALELEGELAEALVGYQRVGSASSVAAERTEALAAPTAEQVAGSLQRSLDAGRDVEVDERLAWLERWLPRERATVEARRRVAAKRGDLPGELSAVRRLAAAIPESRELRWRLGELELAAGDPGRGLEIFEDLARRFPGDPEVADGLARARFSWRLATLPSQVQLAVRKPQLSRSDLATLVYWLVPSIRAGRPSATFIASDMLDHPRREEVVRVVNFGLMRVDDTLHRFEPARLATRAEVNATLARILTTFGKGLSCTRIDLALGELSTRESACALLARCRVVKDAVACAGGGAPSGGEVLDSLRRTLDALGGSGK